MSPLAQSDSGGKERSSLEEEREDSPGNPDLTPHMEGGVEDSPDNPNLGTSAVGEPKHPPGNPNPTSSTAEEVAPSGGGRA